MRPPQFAAFFFSKPCNHEISPNGIKRTIPALQQLVRYWMILLQKSQIAEQQFFRQKTRQAVIAD
jgi:hypothetical protein